MSSIVNLMSFRKKKDTAQTEEHKRIISDNILSDLNEVTDEILTAWNQHQQDGTLDEYVADSLNIENDGILEDLNLIAFISRDVGIHGFTLYGPGAMFINKYGYMMSFRLDGLIELVQDLEEGVDNVFITPEMQTENHARVVGILLHKEYANIAALHRDR